MSEVNNNAETVTTKVVELNYEQRVLASMNKSKTEIQAEEVSATIEEYRLCVEDQISNLDREKPRLARDKKKAQLEVNKATKALAAAKLNLGDNDFKAFLKRIVDAKKAIRAAKKEISGVEAKLESNKEDRVSFEELLAEMA